METYFEKLLQEINYDHIPGLSIEIRDCLKYEDQVLEFKLDINEDKIYIIDVRLKEYDLSNVKNVFSTLLEFIEYTSVFYVREDYDQSVEYSLLSTSKSGLAFYCQIMFR